MDLTLPQHSDSPAAGAPIQKEGRVALEQHAQLPQPGPQRPGLLDQIPLNVSQHHGQIAPLGQVRQLRQGPGRPRGKRHLQQEHILPLQAQVMQPVHMADALEIADLGPQEHPGTVGRQLGPQPIPGLGPAPQKHLRRILAGVEVRRGGHGIHSLGPEHVQHLQALLCAFAAVVHARQDMGMKIDHFLLFFRGLSGAEVASWP